MSGNCGLWGRGLASSVVTRSLPMIEDPGLIPGAASSGMTSRLIHRLTATLESLYWVYSL